MTMVWRPIDMVGELTEKLGGPIKLQGRPTKMTGGIIEMIKKRKKSLFEIILCFTVHS